MRAGVPASRARPAAPGSPAARPRCRDAATGGRRAGSPRPGRPAPRARARRSAGRPAGAPAAGRRAPRAGCPARRSCAPARPAPANRPPAARRRSSGRLRGRQDRKAASWLVGSQGVSVQHGSGETADGALRARSAEKHGLKPHAERQKPAQHRRVGLGRDSACPETQSKMSLSPAASRRSYWSSSAASNEAIWRTRELRQGGCRSPCCRDRRCDRANACAASRDPPARVVHVFPRSGPKGA